jgi:CheY-like chemotaxis protein
MPDMSGVELARRAAAIRPDLQVIFVSGTSPPDQEALTSGWSALRKPYTLKQLQDSLQLANHRRTKRRPDSGDSKRACKASDKPDSAGAASSGEQ